MATRARASASLWGGLSEGATVLVDTAPWIYLLEDHAEFAPRFLGLFEAAERGQIQLALSTVTLAEVLTGPFKAGQTALAKRYETALGAYQVVPLSAAVASLAAQLRVQYRLKLPDAVQLASALRTRHSSGQAANTAARDHHLFVHLVCHAGIVR